MLNLVLVVYEGKGLATFLSLVSCRVQLSLCAFNHSKKCFYIKRKYTLYIFYIHTCIHTNIHTYTCICTYARAT